MEIFLECTNCDFVSLDDVAKTQKETKCPECGESLKEINLCKSGKSESDKFICFECGFCEYCRTHKDHNCPNCASVLTLFEDESNDWRYMSEGQLSVPVSMCDLQNLFNSGDIDGKSLVINKKRPESDWRELRWFEFFKKLKEDLVKPSAILIKEIHLKKASFKECQVCHKLYSNKNEYCPECQKNRIVKSMPCRDKTPVSTFSKCFNCNYQRTERDNFTPEYECPKCGIVYGKYDFLSKKKEAIRDSKSIEETPGAINNSEVENGSNDITSVDKVKKKVSFWNYFSIKDRKSCAQRIKEGGIAAMISASITAILAIGGFWFNSGSSNLDYFLNPWNLIDVILIVVLAIFVFRKSRIASTLLFIYFITAKLYICVESKKAPGIFTTTLFFMYYMSAMRGTYIWHKKFVK